MNMHRLTTIILLLFISVQVYAQGLQLVDARCEYKLNPIGIDIVNPRLSWKINSPERKIIQTAYRVIVADDAMKLRKDIGNVWDSKKISSSASIQVEYTGKSLQSAKTYYL